MVPVQAQQTPGGAEGEGRYRRPQRLEELVLSSSYAIELVDAEIATVQHRSSRDLELVDEVASSGPTASQHRLLLSPPPPPGISQSFVNPIDATFNQEDGATLWPNRPLEVQETVYPTVYPTPHAQCSLEECVGGGEEDPLPRAPVLVEPPTSRGRPRHPAAPQDQSHINSRSPPRGNRVPRGL